MNLNLTMFLQTAVFFVLAVVTMKFIWPPLIAAIDERRRKIAEGLAAADKGEKSLTEAKSAANEILREARGQATKIVDQANRRSGELVDEARGTASAEHDRIVSEAHQEVALESTRAREGLRREAATLAVAAASKLLGREVDPKSHADLLDKLALEIEQG
jgi:F-type H+-transporting ATPase subunit b